MPIHRLVFRIDFDPVFDIFDSTGKIMRILLDEKFGNQKFLPDLLEDSKSHIVSAQFTGKNKDETRTFTVEPISIHGAFECTKGIEYEVLDSYDVFRKFIKLTNIFREEFCINDLKRCGLRFFHFDSVGTSDNSSIKRFNNLMDSQLISNVEQTLGEITDTGFAFNGEHEDKTLYHVKCGPYSPNGRDKYLSRINEKFDEITDHDIIFDIDIFEEKFRINAPVSFKKWCVPIIKKANKITKATIQKLTSEAG